MKKIWIKTLGCIVISLSTIFTSCNKENVLPEKEGEGDVPTGSALFSTAINMGNESITTYATDPNGTDAEEYVTDVRVVLFETGTNGLVKYSWDMGIRYNYNNNGIFDGPDVAIGDATSFKTIARMVDKQKYHMVVLVNPSDKLRELTEVGKAKINFNAALESNNLNDLIGISSGVYNSNNKYRFFMTNADSYMLVEEDDLYPTKDEAETNPVELKVERAVAKVLVKNGIPSTVTDYSIANVSWKLDITNKKTYWMRKQAKIVGGQNGGSLEVSTTPEASRYAEDPNFDNFSEKTKIQLADEFHYITSSDFPSSATQTWGTSNWEYAMENTMEAEEQMQNVTTRVIVRANYVPQITDIVDGTIAAGAGYYTYMGYFISQTQMTIYKDNATNIKDYYAGLATAIKNAKDNQKLLDGSDDSFSLSGLTFYKDGLSFYKILIRHFDDTQVNPNTYLMGYGRYGVVRNNMYEVTITSFNGPGEIDVPEPEPDPDEEEETWVSAKVTIKPWYVRNQSNDL